jgi:hypothetical protein
MMVHVLVLMILLHKKAFVRKHVLMLVKLDQRLMRVIQLVIVLMAKG